MISRISITVFVLALGPFVRAQDLGPYQLILDKQLLGLKKSVPAVVETAAPAVAPVPSWSRDYRMTMISQDGDSIRVGLQNLRDQTSLLLIQGDDTFPEFQLVSGDYDQGTAVVRYRGAEHRFQIQDGPANAAVEPQQNNPSDRGRGGPRGYQPGTMRPGAPASTPYETPAVTPRVRSFKTREELQQHLEAQQMDAIRTGKPPLPIPLTRKMDDELVKEGVLPPQQ